jgi:hypothetical protein
MAQRTPGNSVLVKPKPEQAARKALRSSMGAPLIQIEWLHIINGRNLRANSPDVHRVAMNPGVSTILGTQREFSADKRG